jgi:hypothetical protein
MEGDPRLKLASGLPMSAITPKAGMERSASDVKRVARRLLERQVSWARILEKAGHQVGGRRGNLATPGHVRNRVLEIDLVMPVATAHQPPNTTTLHHHKHGAMAIEKTMSCHDVLHRE